jgi:hypothetical protein
VKLRPGIIAITVVLAAIIVLCFTHPQVMIAPGPVVAAHATIANDCFACHAPFKGAQASRCIACHAPAKIGLFTTKGTPLPPGKVAFHQQLQQPDCLACHTDHAGPALTGHSPVAFRHALLKPTVQARCNSCHTAPAGPRLGGLHKAVAAAQCSTCHGTSDWDRARFSHDALAPAVRSACATCHQRPAGALHRRFGTLTCARCHTTSAWEPSTFAHDRRFRLDRDHDVACATCHTGGNFARYTCYGCHEHRPAQIAAIHREEGIIKLDDCARCHRNGEAEGEGGDDDD